jgi:CheY-like chemotaxis protein
MAQTLLLADDSVTVQRVIELTFADEGLRVVAVGDGAAAIERIQHEPPDIVLADIGMPNRDGYDVASFVKQRADLAHIPVLLLAGAFEPVDQLRVEAIGCDGVLVKPFEPHLVIARVKELLAAGGSRPRPAALIARSEESTTAPTLSDAPASHAESADELFSRLDEAFAKLGMTADSTPAPVPLPPLGELREPAPAPVPPDGPPVTLGPSADRAAPELLVSAFRALLAQERGEPLPVRPSAPSPGRPLDDADVERIVARVLERLNDRVLRDAAKELVAPVAERLVRDEIERIKSSQ